MEKAVHEGKVAKRRTGYHTKPEASLRSSTLSIRVRDNEYEAVSKEAIRSGSSISASIRNIVIADLERRGAI